MGHICHFGPFGRQYFSELRSMRWVDFYNKPHYSYFKPRDLRMFLLPGLSLDVVPCVQTKGSPSHLWKTVKRASVQDRFCITDLSK